MEDLQSHQATMWYCFDLAIADPSVGLIYLNLTHCILRA